MKKLFVSIVIIIMCFTMIGCGQKEEKEVKEINDNPSIVGVWRNNSILPGVNFIYTFNEDGTGKYEFSTTVMNFKYTIEGNKISFKFTDEEMETLDTTFNINGDTLTVKDSNGNPVPYKKVS